MPCFHPGGAGGHPDGQAARRTHDLRGDPALSLIHIFVSNRIADKVTAAEIHNEVFGSDHCPVELVIDL